MVASFCWGIASGVSIILGQMLGRNELEDAKKAGGSFVRFSILIGANLGPDTSCDYTGITGVC